MRSVLFVLGLLVMLLPATVRAQQNAVVMELFTSQGCSACPPADALLPEIASIPGVIALALHVDYWDYLGWKDSFGNVQYTKRQRDYNKALHHRPIFTPQAIVQGSQILVGHKENDIREAVRNFISEPAPVDLRVRRTETGLRVMVEPRGDEPQEPLDVHVVRFLNSVDVSIEGGENAGRSMTYTNIVTDWETVASWDGKRPLTLEIDGLSGDQPVAVILQKQGMGPVVTAAKLD